MLKPSFTRKEKRLKLKGYMAELIDGNSVHEGIIEDVSGGGLRLNNVPGKSIVKGKEYTAVISGGSDNSYFRLQAAVRWKRSNGLYADVGFRILNVPPVWREFIETLMSTERYREQEDIWKQYPESSLG